MMETTQDKLLGGRFTVEQPEKGYRIAVDTLLLAGAIHPQSGLHILDMGCGVGGVMLAIAARLPEARLTGLEVQKELAQLCASNIQRNGFEDRLSVLVGDVAQLPSNLYGAFDQVVMNPPFHDHKSHTLSDNVSKRLAHAEADGADLAVWVRAARDCLHEGGTLTLIHRADRAEEIGAVLQQDFSDIELKPIIARPGASAKRMIFRAKKGMAPDRVLTTLDPLILYGTDNRYSEEAESILRHAQAMTFR